MLIESRIQFGTAAEAEKAVTPLKELFHLRRFIEPGIVMGLLLRIPTGAQAVTEVRMVLKAGGFGDDQTLARCVGLVD